jgi:hypothetical protein
MYLLYHVMGRLMTALVVEICMLCTCAAEPSQGAHLLLRMRCMLRNTPWGPILYEQNESSKHVVNADIFACATTLSTSKSLDHVRDVRNEQ